MDRSKSLWWLGTLVAIAITTTMDASGVSMLSAVPLLPLIFLFWWLEKFPRREMGVCWGRPGDYGLAVLYPLLVIGLLVALVYGLGETDTTDTDWSRTGRIMLLGAVVGILGVALTEEGFFRGWLWASLRRAGWTDRHVLVISSVIFTLWHVSAVVLPTGFEPPARQIPIYLVNATLLGLVWGLLRLRSGSVLVAAVSHSVWNAMAYGLFGFGHEIGALGVARTIIYGPELGVLGTVLSGAFAWWLWRRTFAPETTRSLPDS